MDSKHRLRKLIPGIIKRIEDDIVPKEIMLDSLVKANRDIPNKNIVKGEIGVVFNIEYIDSERYLHIRMDSGKYIGPSCDNCWDFYK